MTEPLGAAALVAALVTTGLMAGLYYAFTISVMPGLARAGDRAFVGVMRQINRAIRNGWFAIAFGGSAVLTALAAVLHLGDPAALPWILAALALYASTLVVTFRVNVPLNDALDAAGDPEARDPREAAAVRAAFEARWVRWNTCRTLACLLAFTCLAVAVLLRGGG
jgi:Predicted integral membrane protein